MEINNNADVITVTIRENGVTATAYLTVYKAEAARTHLTEHINAATSWAPPSLIEYTEEGSLPS